MRFFLTFGAIWRSCALFHNALKNNDTRLRSSNSFTAFATEGYDKRQRKAGAPEFLDDAIARDGLANHLWRILLRPNGEVNELVEIADRRQMPIAVDGPGGLRRRRKRLKNACMDDLSTEPVT
jgi:hypothetical protein